MACRLPEIGMLYVLSGWKGVAIGFWQSYMCSFLTSAIRTYVRAPASKADPFPVTMWILCHIVASGYEARWIMHRRIEWSVLNKLAVDQKPTQQDQQQPVAAGMNRGEKRRARKAAAATTTGDVLVEDTSHKTTEVWTQLYTKDFHQRLRSSAPWRIWNFVALSIPEIIVFRDDQSKNLMQSIPPLWSFVFVLASSWSTRDALAPLASFAAALTISFITFLCVRFVVLLRWILGIDKAKKK